MKHFQHSIVLIAAIIAIASVTIASKLRFKLDSMEHYQIN